MYKFIFKAGKKILKFLLAKKKKKKKRERINSSYHVASPKNRKAIPVSGQNYSKTQSKRCVERREGKCFLISSSKMLLQQNSKLAFFFFT